MMHHDEFHYVSLAVDERGAPYVGTGAEGRVYTVDDAHVVSLVADTDERQVGAIGLAGQRAVRRRAATRGRSTASSSVGGPDAVVDEQAARRGPARALRSPHLARDGRARSVDALRATRRPPTRRGARGAGRSPQGGATPSPARALRAGARAPAATPARRSPT